MYLDDPNEGIRPGTSHPRFVALAPESFYSEGDDFAPFGSDDGHDALRDLEAWYESYGPDADVELFLRDLLAGWGYNIPEHIVTASDVEILAWIAEDDMNEVYLTSVARGRISTVLGMLKVIGRVTPEVLQEGATGIRLLRVMAADTTRYPNWPHREAALRGLVDIETVLQKAGESA